MLFVMTRLLYQFLTAGTSVTGLKLLLMLLIITSLSLIIASHLLFPSSVSVSLMSICRMDALGNQGHDGSEVLESLAMIDEHW